jgi:hypothetical protein
MIEHDAFPIKLPATEVDWEEGVRQLNDCEYLFVSKIRPMELALGLILNEAKPQAEIVVPATASPLERLRDGGRPIEEDATCRQFEVFFEQNSMVSYTVLNESYGKYPEAAEEFVGKLFRVFSKSHLLDFTKKATIACDEYPGPLHHYEIACLNHVIDVITTKPPRIAIGMWKGDR